MYPRQREVSATVLFRDRQDAGRRLAELLSRTVPDRDSVVLALPRGGVPVAREVAWALGLPLDVLIVRKIGVPGHEELAMGAVASSATIVRNEDVLRSLEIDDETFDSVAEEQQHEVQRREQLYRDGPALSIQAKPVILIDDGVATGSTMLAAVRAVRRAGARHVTVAVPV
ncbi:MAG: phosphoribosyltransferase, partial [Candidatus Eremiobacteraeota bacterium]|nr:phosphoribosyltransferase [Candidatus Eremiobacteraeota bacterium]